MDFDMDYEESLEEYKPACELISACTTLLSAESRFGQVTGGNVKIRGLIRLGWLLYSERLCHEVVVWITDEDASLQRAKANLKKWEDLEIWKESNDAAYNFGGNNPWIKAQYDVLGEYPPSLIACLPLFEDFGILLLPADNGCYKRIGSFRPKEWSDFENLPQVEITII
jgi:hypothetical protein